MTTSSYADHTFPVIFTQIPSLICCPHSGEGYNPSYSVFGWLKSKTGFRYIGLTDGLDYIAKGY